MTLRAVVLSTCLTFVAMLALTGGAAAAGPAPARVGLGVAARDVGDLPRGVVSAPTIAPALHLPRPPERGPSTNSPASKYSAAAPSDRAAASYQPPLPPAADRTPPRPVPPSFPAAPPAPPATHNPAPGSASVASNVTVEHATSTTGRPFRTSPPRPQPTRPPVVQIGRTHYQGGLPDQPPPRIHRPAPARSVVHEPILSPVVHQPVLPPVVHQPPRFHIVTQPNPSPIVTQPVPPPTGGEPAPSPSPAPPPITHQPAPPTIRPPAPQPVTSVVPSGGGHVSATSVSGSAPSPEGTSSGTAAADSLPGKLGQVTPAASAGRLALSAPRARTRAGRPARASVESAVGPRPTQARRTAPRATSPRAVAAILGIGIDDLLSAEGAPASTGLTGAPEPYVAETSVPAPFTTTTASGAGPTTSVGSGSAGGGSSSAPGALLALSSIFALTYWRTLQRQLLKIPAGIPQDVPTPPG